MSAKTVVVRITNFFTLIFHCFFSSYIVAKMIRKILVISVSIILMFYRVRAEGSRKFSPSKIYAGCNNETHLANLNCPCRLENQACTRESNSFCIKGICNCMAGTNKNTTLGKCLVYPLLILFFHRHLLFHAILRGTIYSLGP